MDLSATFAPALASFGVRPRRVRPLARAVVRVDADDGRTYALRCRAVSDRIFGDIPLELAWTQALLQETNVRPAEPVPALDGGFIQEVRLPGANEPSDCVLFRWIPGPALADRLTSENVRRLGVLAARLHAHAAAFRPPSGLPIRLLNGLVRGAEQEVLIEHDHPALLPPTRCAVFAAVASRFRQVVDTLYRDPAGRRVIHADLHHENVKVDRGRLRPLDFYEVIWGYPVQDVALTLYDLRFFARQTADQYAALRDAFADGYASRLPWPEAYPGQIDVLIAGRRLRAANWVLIRETAPFARDPIPDPAVIEGFFARLEAEFRGLLESAATGGGSADGR